MTQKGLYTILKGEGEKGTCEKQMLLIRRGERLLEEMGDIIVFDNVCFGVAPTCALQEDNRCSQGGDLRQLSSFEFF